jgi:hypothetical protein
MLRSRPFRLGVKRENEKKMSQFGTVVVYDDDDDDDFKE